MKDLFGAAVKEQSKPLAHGYAATPGTGPAGETCKTCAHICRKTMSKTYLKCGLMRAHWTGGPGSDIRANSPACARWEKAIPETVAEKYRHILCPKPPTETR